MSKKQTVFLVISILALIWNIIVFNIEWIIIAAVCLIINIAVTVKTRENNISKLNKSLI